MFDDLPFVLEFLLLMFNKVIMTPDELKQIIKDNSYFPPKLEVIFDAVDKCFASQHDAKQPDLHKADVMRRQDWECNQCGFKEYTDAVSQSELDQWLQCSNCGGDEFHLVPVFDAMLEEQKLKAANADRFTTQALNMGLLMDATRDYLMSVEPNKTPAEEIIANALDKLGFGRNGLESNFMTA